MVRQSRGFREAAAGLTGEALNSDYEGEERNAPRRAEAGKKFCPTRSKAPKRAKDEELLLAALCRRHGDDAALERPEGAAGADGGSIALVEYLLPLQAKAADRKASDDANEGVGKVALLGVAENGRLVVFDLKYVEAEARRTRTGDTPLRSLLQTLAHCAIVHANREAIAAELQERTTRSINLELRPELIVLGTPRYWELCRKREAQKGAVWIQQMDRLAGEITEAVATPRLLYGASPARRSDRGDGRRRVARAQRAGTAARGLGRVRRPNQAQAEVATQIEVLAGGRRRRSRSGAADPRLRNARGLLPPATGSIIRASGWAWSRVRRAPPRCV